MDPNRSASVHTKESAECNDHKLEQVNTALFFPQDASKSQSNYILDLIRKAKCYIFVCMCFCNWVEFVKLLREKFESGVLVQCIIGYTSAEIFIREGLKCWLAKQMNDDTIMHNKFIVIDGHILMTGSANFSSRTFDGNSENILVTTNREIALQYADEFVKLLKESTEAQADGATT